MWGTVEAMDNPVTRSTAREVLRVSTDDSGRERSNDEQHEANQQAAGQRGWGLVGVPYQSVGSASRYHREPREVFDRLIDDLEHDRFDADILIMWASSRGSRDELEWIRLITLCEIKNVLIYVTAKDKIYDPHNGYDRHALVGDANNAALASYETSIATRRALAMNAVNGKPHGPVAYGYRRTHKTGPHGQMKMSGQEIVPAEAEVIRELFTRIKARHSLRAIARDFAARGIGSRKTGKPFAAQHLGGMARTTQYAGFRVIDGKTFTGDWPAIVDADLFHAVQRIFATRKTVRTSHAKHLLSGTAHCGLCGSIVRHVHERGIGVYECRDNNCVHVRSRDLDLHVIKILFLWHAMDDVPADPGNPELTRALDTVEAIQGELVDLARVLGAGDMSATLAAAAELDIQARLRAAQARVETLRASSRVSELLHPFGSVAAWWTDQPLSAQRELARELLVPGRLGEVRVMRSPIRGHHVPVDQRVVMWRDSV